MSRNTGACDVAGCYGSRRWLYLVPYTFGSHQQFSSTRVAKVCDTHAKPGNWPSTWAPALRRERIG